MENFDYKFKRLGHRKYVHVSQIIGVIKDVTTHFGIPCYDEVQLVFREPIFNQVSFTMDQVKTPSATLAFKYAEQSYKVNIVTGETPLDGQIEDIDKELVNILSEENDQIVATNYSPENYSRICDSMTQLLIDKLVDGAVGTQWWLTKAIYYKQPIFFTGKTPLTAKIKKNRGNLMILTEITCNDEVIANIFSTKGK
nr:hypothetical protein [Pseudodesulfovibrio sp.]